uniref:Uncharacterized protein n=1 Tax=Trichuris muris TaxID=70415 RepID=A0A5S6QFF2_TRIMR
MLQLVAGRVAKWLRCRFDRRKRVTFGTEKEAIVQTFVYDQAVSCDKDEFYESDSSLVEPSLVRVTAVESKLPCTIAPPVAVRELESPPSSDHLGPSSFTPLYTSSPKKMIQENDNPFRPDGSLCHEVDPIVKKYATRPFPNSTGEELIPLSPKQHIDGGTGPDSPRKEDGTVTVLRSPPRGPADTNEVKLVLVNGEQVQTVEVQHKSLTPPKAGTLEMVHVEPRKKHCFCCSVQ